MSSRQSHARLLRWVRKIHRVMGIMLFIFFFVVAVTGLLLGWKKHSGGWILAKTKQGTSANAADWLPLDTLQQMALCKALVFDPFWTNIRIDRIDIRPDKGMAKFLFAEKYLALQLDLATGETLLWEKRRGDFFEQIHDGSVLDKALGISGGWIKLAYTTVMGLALLLFTVTGFWLWYGPKIMKQGSRKNLNRPPAGDSA